MKLRYVLSAASIAALATALVVAVPLVVRLHAQAQTATEPLAFEVASVKPNKSGQPFIRISREPGGRFTATNVPLRELIRFAYQVQNFQMEGLPGWATSDRFDIVAKAAEDPPQAPPTPGVPGPYQIMMQSLLAERFHLAVRRETKELPIYALVLSRKDGKPGAALQPSTTDCAALFAAGRGRGAAPPPPPDPSQPVQCGIRLGIGSLSGGGMPLGQFVLALSQLVNRVVLDRTGLSGNYDFNLTFTPDQSQMPQGLPPPGAPPLPTIDPNGPSIFTALQEQLGLKLDNQKGPVDVLVIDRLEQPTPD